jgi:hypothetical protein
VHGERWCSRALPPAGQRGQRGLQWSMEAAGSPATWVPWPTPSSFQAKGQPARAPTSVTRHHASQTGASDARGGSSRLCSPFLGHNSPPAGWGAAARRMQDAAARALTIVRPGLAAAVHIVQVKVGLLGVKACRGSHMLRLPRPRADCFAAVKTRADQNNTRPRCPLPPAAWRPSPVSRMQIMTP